jgi:hypothetical protein
MLIDTISREKQIKKYTRVEKMKLIDDFTVVCLDKLYISVSISRIFVKHCYYRQNISFFIEKIPR